METGVGWLAHDDSTESVSSMRQHVAVQSHRRDGSLWMVRKNGQSSHSVAVVARWMDGVASRHDSAVNRDVSIKMNGLRTWTNLPLIRSHNLASRSSEMKSPLLGTWTASAEEWNKNRDSFMAYPLTYRWEELCSGDLRQLRVMDIRPR